MRSCLYAHLAAVIYWTAFSVADRKGLITENSGEFSPWLATVAAIFLYPALLAFWICPLVILLLLCAKERPWSQRLTVLVAEVFLWFAQYFAILPAVS